MQRYVQICGAALWLLSSPVFLLAQDEKPAEKPAAKPAVADSTVDGELKLGPKTFKLNHIVGYESKSGDDTRINILMSNSKLPVSVIKAALTEGEGSDQSLLLDQPYLKVVFKTSGKAQHYSVVAGGTSIGGSDEGLEGELKLEAGRATGEATVEAAGKGVFERSFKVKFAVAIGLDQAPKPARPAGPVKPTVTGTFKGNGKLAKLAFVSAHQGEPFDDKPSVVLVFTELDHSKDKKPDFKAGFGDYGCALVISVFENGKIFGCQVAHTGLEKKSISSVGQISTSDFDLGDGQISGEIKTDGELEFFGDKWEVDIKFAAPFVAAPKAVAVAEEPAAPAKKARKSKKKVTDEPAKDKPEGDTPAEPTDMLNIYDLALPEDAADLEYKTLVKHFAFSSGLGTTALVEDFTKRLQKQGWETEGSDLVTPKSSILRRKRGEAEMTIFVKPGDKGSRVTIMSIKGLDWKEKAKKEGEKKE